MIKNSIILTSFLTLGVIGWVTNPKQPSAKAEEYKSSFIDTMDNLKLILDSIENFKNKEIIKYEKQIKSSSEVIEKTQKELKKVSMSTDSLHSLVISFDSVEVVEKDTTQKKFKKRSWLKKQIDKLKNI